MGAALKRPRAAVGAAAAIAEALLEQRLPAVSRKLAPRERRVETATAGLFAGTALTMAILAPQEDEIATAILLTVCYALMRRVRFQLGPGLIRPTQIVFVPMLFLTPAAAVPALVALGSILGELPDVARRRAHPERLLVVLADGWYAVGPALVLATLPGGDAIDAAWGVLLLALAAQIAVDFAASALREWLGAGISPAELLPVMALVYLIDASLAPIGLLAVLASEVYEHAYLLAIAPGALLGLIARERSGRIAHELVLERAFRRSTRVLDARAEARHRQAGRLQSGESGDPPEDRAALERMLLTTTVEALQADCGRLSELDEDGGLHPRLTLGREHRQLRAAELALGTRREGALAIAVGHSHVLAVARAAAPFSRVERDLLEHLAAQAAVSLENQRLEELMRRTSTELRAILEDVAGAVADPLVVRHPGESRWLRVTASPVLEDGDARLAISIIDDITELKQAEQAQRFLAESSRALARSLEVEETLPEVARLAAAALADDCAIYLFEHGELRLVGANRDTIATPPGLEEVAARATPKLWVEPGRTTALAVPILVRDGSAGTITLLNPQFSEPQIAFAEDLGRRVGAAVDNARRYRTHAAIAQTLQQSLLQPELPEIGGVEIAAHYRRAGEGIDVGGDFYDVFSTAEHEWFAVMGDVCGKGAQAASVSAMVRYTIRAAVRPGRSPADILHRLNAAMLRQRAGRFVTIAIARLQLDADGTVIATVSSGGHPRPRILRATGLVEELGTTGTLLGVLEDVDLAERSARLAHGDALVLYTDGLTEVAAPRAWSPARLDAVIAGARRLPAHGIVDHLAEQAEAEAEGPPRDDLALLALRVQPLL